MTDDYESVPLKRVGTATVRINQEAGSMLRTSEFGYYGESDPRGLSRLAEFADWTFAGRHEAAELIADRAECHFHGKIQFRAFGDGLYYLPPAESGDWARMVADYFGGARDFYTPPTTEPGQ